MQNGVDGLFISVEDVRHSLSLDSKWIDHLCNNSQISELKFDDFVQFIESGKLVGKFCNWTAIF